jgi:hypothetical protein
MLKQTYNPGMAFLNELGLWCLTVLSTIFQLYRDGQLLVEEIWENHRPATSHWQTLSCIEYISPDKDSNSHC